MADVDPACGDLDIPNARRGALPGEKDGRESDATVDRRELRVVIADPVGAVVARHVHVLAVVELDRERRVFERVAGAQNVRLGAVLRRPKTRCSVRRRETRLE